tara:strand:- start:1408 stop:1737 length:330 start_codon:yes stop_codon:yes gene_type:complete
MGLFGLPVTGVPNPAQVTLFCALRSVAKSNKAENVKRIGMEIKPLTMVTLFLRLPLKPRIPIYDFLKIFRKQAISLFNFCQYFFQNQIFILHILFNVYSTQGQRLQNLS